MEATKPFFKVHRKEMMWNGQIFALETGKIAPLALGAVMVHHGDTRILCTVTASHDINEETDFFPLSVHYQEKSSASGRIPGGFLKREGKPSDREVLVSRLIDRSLRPLFPDDFHHEVQVVCTVFSFDPRVDSVVASIVGASTAILQAGLPVEVPVAAARIGYEQGKGFCTHSTGSDLDLVMATSPNGLVMVEAEVQEHDEAFILQAIQYGHESLAPLLQFINEFVQQTQHRHPFSYHHHDTKDLEEAIEQEGSSQWEAIYALHDFHQQGLRLQSLKKEIHTKLHEKGQIGQQSTHFSKAFSKVWKKKIRHLIISSGKRLDGRSFKEIRPIACEVGLLPRAHGSALFTRGPTQALVSVTLGSREDAQLTESLSGSSKDSFLLHYNFPPFSVGEVGKMMSPGRREIGHGKLAWRALQAVLPSKKVFPYTVRVISDITSSCGSSSMATICGSIAALADAGVPITGLVAGVTIGLLYEENKEGILLSDISGLEDGMGNMDLKIAGTLKGITALQMDLKGTPLSFSIMEKALTQAHEGRLHILEIMASQSLSVPRANLSPYAPSASTVKIDPDKIRDLIGPGGKNIRELCESTGAKIDIGEDGTVSIFSSNEKSSQVVLARIKQLTGSPIVGEIYSGIITKLLEFGAFVNFGFSQEGMVHISEIMPERVHNIHDVLSVGQKVRVRFLENEGKGRFKLSIKKAIEM